MMYAQPMVSQQQQVPQQQSAPMMVPQGSVVMVGPQQQPPTAFMQQQQMVSPPQQGGGGGVQAMSGGGSGSGVPQQLVPMGMMGGQAIQTSQAMNMFMSTPATTTAPTQLGTGIAAVIQTPPPHQYHQFTPSASGSFTGGPPSMFALSGSGTNHHHQMSMGSSGGGGGNNNMVAPPNNMAPGGGSIHSSVGYTNSICSATGGGAGGGASGQQPQHAAGGGVGVGLSLGGILPLPGGNSGSGGHSSGSFGGGSGGTWNGPNLPIGFNVGGRGAGKMGMSPPTMSVPSGGSHTTGSGGPPYHSKNHFGGGGGVQAMSGSGSGSTGTGGRSLVFGGSGGGVAKSPQSLTTSLGGGGGPVMVGVQAPHRCPATAAQIPSASRVVTIGGAPHTGTSGGMGGSAGTSSGSATTTRSAPPLNTAGISIKIGGPLPTIPPPKASIMYGPDSMELNVEGDKGPKQLIVNYISPQVKIDELYELFAQFGPVECAKILFDRDGTTRGFGFVYYASSADATTALSNLQSFEFYGKYLRLGYAVPQRAAPAKDEEKDVIIPKE